jgi:RND family efflux transporter MFP subunit
MTPIQFLAEWGIRSSILILSGALLLWALRVKDPVIRLTAWTAMLFGSLAIPALTAALPKVPLAMVRLAVPRFSARPVAEPVVVPDTAPIGPVSRQNGGFAKPGNRGIARFDWARAAVTIYSLAALALALRVSVGLAIGLRLLRSSRATGRATGGIEIRESDRVAAPVTLGIARPAIVLPGDWRQWAGAKLDAVVAHELSHIRRHDPAVQLLSAIHRALLWYSPLTWFLHQRIVRAAEEASDDAAVAASGDRALYAEVLLDFMQGAGGSSVQGTGWLGVPMSRYGRPDKRIHRILDGTALSRGVTRWSVAAILAMGSPLAYVVAAAGPQGTPQSAPPARAAAALAAPVQAATEKPAFVALPARQSGQNPREVSVGALPGSRLMAPQIVAQSAAAATPEPVPVYLYGLGNVAAFYTVTVKSRVDGQLLSASFKEGELVHAGQLLASIDPQPYELQLAQAEGQLVRDQATLKGARAELDRITSQVAARVIPKPQLEAQIATVAELEGSMRTDQAKVDLARLQLSYARIRAPITGVAGLRLVDPGNIIHAADANGILVITQLQPIAVLFTIPEDTLPQVRARLREGASLPVEAWSRDNTVKMATGRLTAVDNQIDQETGTAKLKAVFDNKDDALFPNQFVNVRMLMNGR